MGMLSQRSERSYSTEKTDTGDPLIFRSPHRYLQHRSSLLHVRSLPGILETAWVRLIYADEESVNGKDRFVEITTVAL